MTEEMWRTWGDRTHMRRQLRNWRFSPLRWISFNLACIERVRELIDDARCHRFLHRLERLSDRTALAALRLKPSVEEFGVTAAIGELWRRCDDPLRGAKIAAARAVLTAKFHTLATSEMVALAVGRWRYGEDEERRSHCAFLRDIYGNPFRPITFAPEWRTGTTTAIARQMYESRDFSAMPILADAMQDVGCNNDDVLAHCRDPQQVHVRGCWVVDLVLGKE
ncbi:hypothetical protein R5W24_003455 [Gemmata sp. JC717]|uniref:hypothetical protein n=1 Tax=Gemmata algarum TaxID=2975278 RepID=UPI0021BB35AC|nr:hypothetical protein [Gemmata algarum]MDY3554335.1 hypothetical protein [Gemmata algarum]